jgi:hypothetical protein
MTDQTGPDSTETNDSLGVVGAQLARQEEVQRAGAAFSTPVLGRDTLALEALRLANQHDELPDAVVSRADAYLDFLTKGQDNG